MSIHNYTKQEKYDARHTDIAAFLVSHGAQLKRSGGELEWNYGCEKITIRGSAWFNHYRMEGGNALDFVRKFYDVDFPTAMEMLLGRTGSSEPVPCFPQSEKKSKTEHGDFALPESHRNFRRVFTYLHRYRRIDPDIINYFHAKRMLYEDTPYHNAVFVGFDEAGVPRHAHRRGSHNTAFKGNCVASDLNYSFHHIGTSDRIYVFEAPIDMLSFISMNQDRWQEDSYVALCSVASAALLHQLEVNPKLRSVYLCLDNDNAGNAACERITNQLRKQGDYCVERLTPTLKDWNEDLCSIEEESLTQGM